MKTIDKLCNKLRNIYYSANKKSFILDIDLDEITQKDLKKNANKTDIVLLDNIIDKKWKLLDKSRKLFKVFDKINYNIQIREHPKKENKKDLYSRTNSSKLAKYVFSSIAGSTNLNSTELPVINLDLKKVPEKLVRKLKIFEIDIDNTKNYSVEITEHFFKMIKLSEFLKINNKLSDIKSVLFYIFFTLYNYKKIYPNFQHNSLSIDNIFVYLIDKNEEEEEYNEYIVDGVKFVIPNIGA